jgi:hypothetical protein
MESYSVIIGLVILSLFILPLWYFQRSQHKAEKNLSKLFKQIAVTNGLLLTQSDKWHNMYSIGIDDKHNRLLYLKHKSTGDQKQVIDLSTIAKCSIEKKIRNVGKGKHQSKVIENIKLVLTQQDVAHTQHVLEFYDVAESGLMNGEITLVEKWRYLIESKVATNKV